MTEIPLDRDIRAVVQAFKVLPPSGRDAARLSISMDQLYDLTGFASRSSVLALHERSPERCEEGLLALAMIDETRLDPRDAMLAAGVLGHALGAVGADRTRLVEQAARLATPGMAEIISRANGPEPLSEWGYAEVRGGDGRVGLIRASFEDYAPSLDLTRCAQQLAAQVRNSGRYVPEVEIAVDVPAVWFGKTHEASANTLLQGARGAIQVHGRLRSSFTDQPFDQMFVQWVAEMPSADGANTLARYAGINTAHRGRYATGVAVGRLFGLIVAGSSREGVAPFESPETIDGIARDLRALLEETLREEQ